MNISYVLSSIFVFTILNLQLSSAAVVPKSARSFDQKASIGSTVHLSCRSSEVYGSEVAWDRIRQVKS